MPAYPGADDYAYSLEPKQIAKHLRSNATLLQEIVAGKALKPSKGPYLHWENGYYAYIYKFKSISRTYALRCFRIAPPPDSAQRLQAIGNFVAQKHPPYLVECNHFDDVLYVSLGGKGQWYPLQVMEWVEGATLTREVNERVKSDDRLGLSRLADSWESLLRSIKEDGVVHGDLHPDNVIVMPKTGQLRLIDYDTMVIPGFSTMSFRGLGMSTYIHPCYSGQSAERHYSSTMDDFGALNILLSLRALAENPRLRSTKDYLLFHTEDIERPTQSALLNQLCRSGDKRISDLANAMREECKSAIETGRFVVDRILSGVVSNPSSTVFSVVAPSSDKKNNKLTTPPTHYMERADIPSSVSSSQTQLRTAPSEYKEQEIPSSTTSPRTRANQTLGEYKEQEIPSSVTPAVRISPVAGSANSTEK